LVFAAYSVFKISVEICEIAREKNEFSRMDIIKILSRYSIEVAIFLVSCFYGFLYLFYIFIQIKKRYGAEQGEGFFSTIFQSFVENPLVGFFFLIIFWRLFLFRKNRRNYHPVLDPLAGGMVLYYSALIILEMTVSYYYLPICFMTLMLFAETFNISKSKNIKLFAIPVCVLIFAYNLPSTLLFFDRRENYMSSREVAVDELRKILLSDLQTPKEILFLDRNAGYDTNQFIAFANFMRIGRDLELYNSTDKANNSSMMPIRPIFLPLSYGQKISADAIESDLFVSNNVQACEKVFLALPDFSGFNNFLITESNSKQAHFLIPARESFLRQTILKRFLSETVDYPILSGSF
jgi:hypothetical protein